MDCESITKYVCLKHDAFDCNRSLKCSVPESENYSGSKECTKYALCFKCKKEEHAANEKLTETSDDVELAIHCVSGGFDEYQKILKVLLSSDNFLEKYPDLVNTS